MKKLLFITLCVLAGSSLLEARRYHRHGGWGRGWGWGGPAVGVGFTVPIGGGSSGPKMPYAVKQYNRETGNRSNYQPGAREFCRWAQGYFTKNKAESVCEQYQNYLTAPRTYSQPTGAISFGVGGGGYGYPYGYGWGGPYRRWWW